MSSYHRSYQQESDLRYMATPEFKAQQLACDVRDTAAIVARTPCPEPDCAAPVGQHCKCAGDPPHAVHQLRAISHGDAVLFERNERERRAQLAA